jgi:hypothetical protein
VVFAVPGTVDIADVGRDRLTRVRNMPSFSPKVRHSLLPSFSPKACAH